jgi:hypothetical protein
VFPVLNLISGEGSKCSVPLHLKQSLSTGRCLVAIATYGGPSQRSVQPAAYWSGGIRGCSGRRRKYVYSRRNDHERKQRHYVCGTGTAFNNTSGSQPRVARDALGTFLSLESHYIIGGELTFTPIH